MRGLSVGLVTPQPTSSYGMSANFALRAGVTVGKLGGRTFPGAGPRNQPTWAWGCPEHIIPEMTRPPKKRSSERKRGLKLKSYYG